VEDEPTILELGAMMLKKFGYRVMTAGGARDAIALAESYEGVIDLLVTDVVMPEMNGRDLAQHLHSMRPGLKCLFMSGYTADVIAHHGVLDPGVHFIQKPFSVQNLAAKVREALDA
jgi:DNA-binding NtrC family response regulator